MDLRKFACICFLGFGVNCFADGLRLPQGFARSSDTPAEPVWQIVAENGYDDPAILPGPYRNIWGLFIGVTKYERPEYNGLKNPGHDARDLSRTLQEVSGLREPVVLVDEKATLEGVREALSALGKKIGPGDLFIFAFSGHGVGLENKVSGQKTGRMLLHEAPAFAQLVQGKNGSGVVDMVLLSRLIEDAGIKAKHQLHLLDCCYSGMGAVARARNIGAAERESQFEEMMRKKAIYVITAGGSDQPVLDGFTVDGHGNGLLTEFLIKALRNPGQFNLRTLTHRGVSYLPLRELFDAGEFVVPGNAKNIFETVVKAQAQAEKNSRSLATRNPAQPVLSPEVVEVIKKKAQRPQDDRKEGEGRVFLPLLTTKAGDAGPSKPSGPNPLAASNSVPTAPTVPVPPAPGVEPAPVASEVVLATGLAAASYEPWADQVGEKFKAKEYATALKRLFKLLAEGAPKTSRTEIAFSADFFSRPKVSEEELNRAMARDNLANLSMEEKWIRLEKWRKTVPGADWQMLPRRGAVISENFEYRFEMANTGTEPIRYYLIAIDQAGIVQWMAPQNESWNDTKEGTSITFGKSPLIGGDALNLPPVEMFGKEILTKGWPVEGELNQQFILVASPGEWLDLKTALHDASALAYRLYSQPEAQRAVGAGLPSSGSRAVGRVTTYLKDQPKPAATPAAIPTEVPVITRVDGNLVVVTWDVRVIPSEQLKAEVDRLKNDGK